MKKRLVEVLPAAILAGIACALFSIGLTDGHLQLDDWGYTLGCPFVASGLSAANIVRAFRDLGHGGIWMPLTYITYMADITLFGGGWFVHHATNVVLHALNAALVCFFLRALLRRLLPEARHLSWACFGAALLWSVHPMRAEAVVWIASRKEELWALFALLASFAWLRFLDRRIFAHYAFALIFFVLACLAKPTAVCLPLVFFALEACLGGKPLRVFKYVPMLCVSAGIGLIAIYSQTHPTGMPRVDVFGTSFVWRLTNAAVSLGLYLAHTVCPTGIHIDYRAVPNAMPLDAALGLSVLALVLVAVSYGIVRSRGPVRRALILAAVLFILTLLPVLGLVGFTGDKAYADRYLYLPAVALMIPLAVGLLAARRRWGGGRVTVPLGLISLGLALAAIPVIRSFRDDATACRRVLSFDPQHARALRIGGSIRCTQEGGMDDGIAMLRKSLALRPSPMTVHALAYVLAIRGQAGDFDQVRKLGRAVVPPLEQDREGLMLEALAIVAMRTGNDAEAVRLFHAAVRAPARSHTPLHALLNLGLSLANCGRMREATAVLQRVRAMDRGPIRARANRALEAIRDGESVRFAWSAN